MAPKGTNAKNESGRATKVENKAKKQQTVAAERVPSQPFCAVLRVAHTPAGTPCSLHPPTLFSSEVQISKISGVFHIL